MNPLIGQGLIGAGSGILGSVLGLFGQSSTNKLNWKINQSNQAFADRQATLSYNRQRQLIADQNAYNSPLNQRKLLEQAGYNPYNAVGQTAGTAVSTSSTNAPQASQPSSIPMQFDPAVLNGISQAGLNFAQIRNIDADTDKKKAETGLTSQQELLLKSQTSYQDLQNDLLDKYGDIKERLGLDLIDSQRALNDANRNVAVLTEKLANYDLTKIKPAEYANLVATNANIMIDSYLKKVTAAKTEEERVMLSKQFALQVKLYELQAYMTYAQVNNIDSDTALKKQQYGMWQAGGLFNSSAYHQMQGVALDNQSKLYNNKLIKDNWVDYDAQFRSYLKASFMTNTRIYFRDSQFGYTGNWYDEPFSRFNHGLDGLGSIINFSLPIK